MSLKDLKNYVAQHWETWAAAFVSVAVAGLESFSDYLPLIAGTLGGWPLVLVVSVTSFALATFKAKKRKACGVTKAKPKAKSEA